MLKWLKAYFRLSRGETWGFVTLALLLVAFMVLPALLKWLNDPVIKQNDQHFREEVEQFLNTRKKATAPSSKKENRQATEEPTKEPTYSPFNPNKIAYEDWRQMGVPGKLAHRIENYKEAGGHFYEKSDLKSIYGMPDSLYQQLAPYIRLPKAAEPSGNETAKAEPPKDTAEKAEKRPGSESEKAQKRVAINSADTGELKTINGIGDFFAKEIVKLRDQFGGFHDKSQLTRIYRLDSAHLAQIAPALRIDSSNIQPLSFRDSSFKAFLRHPYLNYPAVKALFDYKDKQDSITQRMIQRLDKEQVIGQKRFRQIRPSLAP